MLRFNAMLTFETQLQEGNRAVAKALGDAEQEEEMANKAEEDLSEHLVASGCAEPLLAPLPALRPLQAQGRRCVRTDGDACHARLEHKRAGPSPGHGEEQGMPA